jgi:FkbM family methyltransferase
MIDIKYTHEIKIETGQLDKIFSEDQLPLRVHIKNSVSKEIIWTSNMSNFMWASYPNSEMADVLITDAKGVFVYQYFWDVLAHGSIFYKSLWLYCKSLAVQGRMAKGLAIGTHDGEFGEWCPLVKNHLSEILLVEASEKQFTKLEKNYKNKIGVNLLNQLITTDGKDVEFFEGGRGYTNSVVERVIKSWESEEIKSTVRSSISINDLIESYTGKLDWIHLDIEGLDAKLLMSIKDELLPNFIIFEDANLLDDEKSTLMKYLADRGYLSKSEGGICMSIRS